RAEQRATVDEPLRQGAAARPVLVLLAPVVVPDVHAATLTDKEATFCHDSGSRARDEARLAPAPPADARAAHRAGDRGHPRGLGADGASRRRVTHCCGGP